MRASRRVVFLAGAACALSLSQVADATSVNLRFVSGTGGAITGLGTNTVTVSSEPTTLTLDIRIAVDSASLSGAFLSLEFDRDLRDELNVISFQELVWTGVMMAAMALPEFTPFVAGLSPTQESSATDTGLLYTFDSTTLSTASDCCPVSTTVAFGRVVFAVNPTNLARDGGDIFAYLFNIGVDAIFDVNNNDIGTAVFPSTFATGPLNAPNYASVNATGPAPTAVKSLYADFDRNLRSDILVFNSSSRSTYEFLMNASVNGTVPLSTSTSGPPIPVGWAVVGIADVSGDQQADLIAYDPSTLGTYIFEMRGGVVLDAASGPSLPDNSWTIAGVGDFNNDQLCDILALRTTTGLTYQFHLDGSQAGITTLGTSTAGPTLGGGESIIGIGQFDGVNGDDFMTVDAGGVTRQYHLTTTGGLLGTGGGSVVIPAGWGAAAVGDFDNNDRSDLLVVELATGRGYFFLLDGLTVLGTSDVFNRAAFLPAGWEVGTVGDFDADGSSDVVVRETAGSRTMYLYLINGTSASTSSGSVGVLPAATWIIPVSNQANL